MRSIGATMLGCNTVDKELVVGTIRCLAMVEAYKFELLEFTRMGLHKEALEAALELKKLAERIAQTLGSEA